MFDEFVSHYPTYKLVEKPSEQMIRSYEGKLPEPILTFWREYGWGMFMNGYLRFVNPADFQEVADECIENIGYQSIPIAVSAFGDLFVWERDGDGYVNFFDLRHSKSEIIGTLKGLDLLFNKKLTDESIWTRLHAEQYSEAASKLGVPGFDQCFGYVPLLALGGSESVNNLQLVDVQTHMAIMAQAVGPL